MPPTQRGLPQTIRTDKKSFSITYFSQHHCYMQIKQFNSVEP